MLGFPLAHICNMLSNVFLATYVFKGIQCYKRWKSSSNDLQCPKSLTETTAKSFSPSLLTKVSVGRHKPRGNKSKCSTLKRKHLLSKGQDSLFVILNTKHLIITTLWSELANFYPTDKTQLRERKRKAWMWHSKNLLQDPKQETEIGIIDHFMLNTEQTYRICYVLAISFELDRITLA